MLKKKWFVRVLCLVFVVAMLLPMMMACGNDADPDAIEVKWYLGKITSGDSSVEKNKRWMIVKDAENYSYSDIINIPEAGTTIMFYDYVSEEDPHHASADTLIVSHWVEDNGTWKLQNPGDNYTGGMQDRALEITTVKKGEYRLYTYTSTYDNEYIRLCYRSGQTAENTAEFQFAEVVMKRMGKKGTLASNPEEMAKLEDKQFIDKSKYDMFYDEMEAIDVVCIGDSYMDDSAVSPNMWIELFERKYNFNMCNHALSGSTANNNKNNITRNETATTVGSNPMCDRLTDPNAKKSFVDCPDCPAAADVDLIFFDCGRNDFSRDTPLGFLHQMNNPDLPLNTDTTTFYGAVNYIIAKLKEMFPNALIIGLTCWSVERTNSVTGHTQVDFGKAMLAACAANGVPCLDNTDKELTKVDMDSAYFRAQYCKAADDISHLNAEGAKNYLPIIEKFVGEEYKKFLAAKSAQ